jgi:hypothetical protein
MTRTQQIADEMIEAIRQYPEGEKIIAVSFNWAWRTRCANVAFRKAHDLGLIRPAYKSVDGSQVWERTGR